MCGRFTQAYSWAELYEQYDLFLKTGATPNLQARYNIAPTTTIQIIVKTANGRELREARWGLIPPWHKGGLKDFKLATFNAKIETVEEKATFRSAYKKNRCIIPASGFFEWTGDKPPKTPHYFTAKDGAILAFAGLFERWKSPEGEWITTATIIVREADEWTKKYHDRMPCMLHPDDFDAWLDGSGGMKVLQRPPKEMQEWIVSQRVNKTGVGDDDPDTIKPV